MALRDWERFIGSDSALQLSRVCKFYSVYPGFFFPKEDRFTQLAISEALMLKHMVWEHEEEKKAQEEQERQQKIQQGLANPGTASPVTPPTPEEILQQIEQNR